MMANIGIIFFSLIVPIIDAKGYPIITLDIGKRDGYHSGSHNIKVQKHDVLNAKDGQVFYKHIPPAKSRISELTLDGHYIHSDFIPPTDDYVLSSLVHWKNGRPDMVTLDCIMTTVFLWNNGNGRLVHQASTIREGYGIQTASVLDRQVTIDVDQKSDSRLGTLYKNSDKSIKFSVLVDPELPGYLICRHTGYPFMVEKVVNGKVSTNIEVTPEVHNVYVYKWNNVPLLADFELFNGKRLSFADMGSRWEPIFTPSNDNYRRMPYLRDLLGYINCRHHNRVIIDIKVQSNTTYYGGACKFLKMDERQGTHVTVEKQSHKNGYIGDYDEYKHKVRNGATFDINHIVNGDNRVIINLPNRPTKSFSYFVKNKKSKDKGHSLYIEIFTTHRDYPYEYYMHNGGEEFLKLAVSNWRLGKTELSKHTPSKVYIWKNGRPTN